MTDITDQEGYLAPFKGKEQAALKEAIETRKLEVDLYTRGTAGSPAHRPDFTPTGLPDRFNL